MVHREMNKPRGIANMMVFGILRTLLPPCRLNHDPTHKQHSSTKFLLKNFGFKVPALTKSIQVNFEMRKCVYCLVINLTDDLKKKLGKGPKGKPEWLFTCMFKWFTGFLLLVPLIKTGQDWDRLQTANLLKSLAIDGEGTCGSTSFTCCTIRVSLVLGLALSWLEGVLPFWTDLVSWAWTLACATK